MTKPLKPGEKNDELLRQRIEVGRWLKEQREAAGLTQRELAERIGTVYYTYISQIELGQGKIIPERWATFAKALNLDKRSFSIRMLKAYEPFAYRMIFGED